MVFGADNWKKRLDRELGKLTKATGYQEVTYKRLRDVVEAPSERLLAEEVTRRILDGRVRVFYRVINSKKVEVEKYDNLLDIPDELIDVSTGEPFEVDRFRNVEAVYVADKFIEH